MNVLEGKRIFKKDDEYPTNPGEYMKNEDGSWLLCVPTGIHGTINNKWNITEHDDGSITVIPSIQVTCHVPKYNWHGYIEKGIWREC